MAEKQARFRTWFLTIHKEAPCYDTAFEICATLRTTCWAGIVHDKDMEILADGNEVLAPTHKHIVLELENATTFNALQKHFQGAHIENPVNLKSSYRYLTHSTPKSRAKWQYPASEIVTDFPMKIKAMLEEEAEPFEPFIESKWKQYIAEGVVNPWKFATRFGVKALKEYGRPFMELVNWFATHTDVEEEILRIGTHLAEERKELPFLKEGEEE